MRRNKTRSAFIGIAAIFALVIAGCGSSGSSDNSESSAVGDASQAPGESDATKSSTPQGSGTPDDSAEGERVLTAIYPAVATTLQPQVWEGNASRWVGFQIHGPLFDWNADGLAGEGCTELATLGNLEGSLATEWEWSDEDSAYIIKLRDAVSEFGNPLTADDVVYTFDRIYALKGNAYGLLQAIEIDGDNPVTKIDESTFSLNMIRKGTVDLAPISWKAFSIIDSIAAKEHATDEDPWSEEWLTSNTATFGAWTVDESEFVSAEQIVLRPNEHYWGERGNIDKIIMRAVPDAGTRLQLLQSGDAQYVKGIAYDQLPAAASSPGIAVEQCASADRITLGLNNTDPILQDSAVRRALSMAIDRDAIVERAYHGYVKPAASGANSAFLPRGYEPTGESLKYNPEEAQKLLADAGYGDGFELVLSYNLAQPGSENEQVALLLQDQLKAIGVNVRLDLMASQADFVGAAANGNLQAWLNILPPAEPDIAYDSGLYYFSEGLQNYFQYDSERFDTVYKQVNIEPLGEERDAMTIEMNNILEEEVPTPWLVESMFVMTVSEDVTGIRHYPTGELMFRDVSIP